MTGNLYDSERLRRLPADAQFAHEVGLRRRCPASSLAPSSIHLAMTSILLLRQRLAGVLGRHASLSVDVQHRR